MRESHSAGVPLPFFRPSHKLSQEFSGLAQELIDHDKPARDGKAKGRRRPSTQPEA